MRVKTLVDERFDDYKKPVMLIGTISCDGKCCRDAKTPLKVCQNDGWRQAASIEMADDDIITRYMDNKITSAICFGGLEPFEQFEEVLAFISRLRTKYKNDDPVIIYTGYDESEISSQVEALKRYKNIVIKFGRFVPNQASHYDDILGVKLASPNQYAKKIS